MGELPPERMQPATPFEFTTVDLFGHCHVKDDVKKRALLKVWGVVFSCMSSRAKVSFLEGIDKSALEEAATKIGMEWIWKIHPADSPHRNGAAEAAVRIIKRALSLTVNFRQPFKWQLISLTNDQ